MIEYKKLSNNFQYIEVKNSKAKAKIALQGAHIFEYTRSDEEPILWISEASNFKYGESIRGGIPICWPWFGLAKDKNLPQHGFVRIFIWEFHNTSEIDKNTTEIILKLKHSKQSLKLWSYKFELELKILISDNLTLMLKTKNLNDKPFTITQALHSYFNISHISEVSIKGFDKKPYLDALTMKQKKQNGDIIFNKEVDRVYQEVNDEISLKDKNRVISIKNIGSSSVVVWNPWIDKCKRMSAMNDDSYKTMVCIETANAFDDKRVLKPNQSHTLEAVIF
ncbi:MAG: D-hexose-6-phosphate mutarotase [Sulfurimonas sp.]|nr:D-hexose-6-phosphate mutarotase [Sulfurimonas sp.]